MLPALLSQGMFTPGFTSVGSVSRAPHIMAQRSVAARFVSTQSFNTDAQKPTETRLYQFREIAVALRPTVRASFGLSQPLRELGEGRTPVSYTHLTLPTNHRV